MTGDPLDVDPVRALLHQANQKRLEEHLCGLVGNPLPLPRAAEGDQEPVPRPVRVVQRINRARITLGTLYRIQTDTTTVGPCPRWRCRDPVDHATDRPSIYT